MDLKRIKIKYIKRLAFITIAIALASGIILCCSTVSVKAETSAKETVISTYDSIKVGHGETLDEIAREYNTAGIMTNNEYIAEVKRINKIYTDTIHAGCYLTVISYN